MAKFTSRYFVTLAVLFCCLIILGFDGTRESQSEKYREIRLMMGTIVRLDVCQNGQNMDQIDGAYKKVWERLEDIAWRMNVFDERSDVAKINNSFSEPVSIGEDTYEVLESSIYFSQATNGAFDITVWPLIKLWQESEKENAYPSGEQIKMAQAAVGNGYIQLLDKNQIKLLNRNTKIDLGGIAMGYAVDEAARIFLEHGITSFFIDGGGDIYVGGNNCSGNPWRIGIRDPRDKSKIIDVVELTNGAVTTSGNYEQYYSIQNEQWSHIINPITGYPQKEVVSATFIAPTAIEADALATALCVLGSEKGTEYTNSLDGRYASLIIVKREPDQIKKYFSQEYAKYFD